MINKPKGKLASATRTAIQRHLEWVYLLITRRPGLVFSACCLTFLLSCVSITRIEFQADIFKMFPHKGPLALFLDVMQWTGNSGNAYFLLEGENEQVIAEADRFAAKLRNLRIDGFPAFKTVKNRVFGPTEDKSFATFISYAVTHPQLFVSPTEIPQYLRHLSPQEIEQSLRRAKIELATFASIQDVVAADPLYLRSAILPRLKKASEALDLDPASPYFISRDGKVLIIIAEPARPVTDVNFARKLVTGINQARKDSSVNISCTGAHLSAVTDEAIMKKNVIEGVVFSLVIVLALFYVAYRRFLPTILIPIILCFGVVLSVAVGGLIYPKMSIIAFAFASLIIGIGTDYTIHLYDRFHFERALGLSTEEALRLAVIDTGHALFTASTTTAIPFLALMISDVAALAELGLLVGLGVIFSFYVTLFFLPPLLLFMENRFPLKKYRPLPSFGLWWVWRSITCHPKPMTAVALIIVLASLLSAKDIQFEAELKNLQPRSSEAFQAQQKLEQHLSISPKEMIVATDATDLGRAISGESKIAALAEKYRQKGQLVTFSSLASVVNAPEAQASGVTCLRSWVGFSGLRGELEQALVKEGFEPRRFDGYINRLADLSRATPIPVSEGINQLAASPFKGIVDRHLARTAGGYHTLTYLNYRGNDFRQDIFLQELQQAVPGARATSIDLVSSQLTESVRESFLYAAMLGVVLVLFLLISHFSSLTGILCSLWPMIAGVVAMIGIMPLLDMRLNFMNVMVLVTIMGMGSDYGLHIAHRIRNCSRDEYETRFVQSARAVILSGVSTIAGFGSLALTDYGAMASIGWTTNLGVVATTFFTLLSVPALVTLVERRRTVTSDS